MPHVDPPKSTECLTGQLRLLRSVGNDPDDVLQQEWEDLLTSEKTWRNVLVVLMPLKGVG